MESQEYAKVLVISDAYLFQLKKVIRTLLSAKLLDKIAKILCLNKETNFPKNLILSKISCESAYVKVRRLFLYHNENIKKEYHNLKIKIAVFYSQVAMIFCIVYKMYEDETMDKNKVSVCNIIYYKNTFGVQNLHLGYKTLTFDINSDIIYLR